MLCLTIDVESDTSLGAPRTPHVLRAVAIGLGVAMALACGGLGASQGERPRIRPNPDANDMAERARLERDGNVIGANDLWIAAHALAAECCIVTDNEREFARVEALPRENWLRTLID